jgi:tetratricopeptide (TPR) repeat protein
VHKTPLESTKSERIQFAQLLVEVGELHDAEQEVSEVLDGHPEDLTALNLMAKIKHVRGELSQAIALWAQIHARSPHSERALMYLGSILQLARDPVRGAGEYLALGPGQFVHKPAAHLDLEGAFRAFLLHRVDEAYATCERLAHRWRLQDPMLYKLAVLAKAWIAELSGNLEVACVTLETLGQERGFETDVDRVLSLARVYERLGTRERLEKAAHVFRFLERNYAKVSAVARLARIYRRLADPDRAAAYETRWRESFEARMHRPTLADAVRVAGDRYVPLDWLSRLREGVRQREDVSAVGEDPRLQALAAFVLGDVRAARELLGRRREWLDEAYLAELDAMEGDVSASAARFARLFGEGSPAPDLRVLTTMLQACERTRSSALERVAAGALSRPEARREVEAHWRANPLRPEAWREMGTLQRLLGQAEEAGRCAERAQALVEAAGRDALPIGRVLAAAVFQFVGKSKGLIHQVWADRRPVEPGRGGFLSTDDILGNVTLEMKQNVRSTFLAVREYARSRFPRQTSDVLDYQYTYKVTKEDEPSGGPSAGLPTALAFLSVLLQKPVPQDVAFSGVLIADSHDALVVRSVGDAAYKVKGAYHRNLRCIVMPAENRADLAASALVPPAVCERFVRFVTTLDQAVRLTFGEDVFLGRR